MGTMLLSLYTSKEAIRKTDNQKGIFKGYCLIVHFFFLNSGGSCKKLYSSDKLYR